MLPTAKNNTRPIGCQIFISHSSHDNLTAVIVARHLRDWGFQSLFLDFDPELGIPAGRDWEQEIYRHISASGAVIALCSINSSASKWCFAEVALARALGKEVIPLLLDACPAERLLSDRQYIDLKLPGSEPYERLRRGLREAGLDPDDDFAWDHSREPYPGLNVFTEEDAGVYFGRDDLIRESLDRLNQVATSDASQVVLVIGGSGSGKSSLVRAGIVPRLKKTGRNWCVLPPIRPRTAPLQALAQSLAEAPPYPDWKPLRDRLLSADEESEEALTDACLDARLAMNRRDAPVLIVIDQLEDTLSQPSSAEVVAFHLLLRRSIDNRRGLIVALATLRSDFLGVFQNHDQWRDMRSIPALINVPPMRLRTFPQIIEGPAARVGLRVEPGLVQSITQDAATEDALPLLAFALRELYDRCKQRGRLTLDIYRDELGGLQGAVARVVERLKHETQLDQSQSLEIPRAFLHLVQMNDDGRIARRTAILDEMPPGAIPFLEQCVSSRLLTVSYSSGTRTIEITHESLLRVWTELAAWIEENRHFLRWLRRFRMDTEEWTSGHRQPTLLLSTGRLSDARKWIEQRPNDFAAIEQEFIEASITHEDQRLVEEADRERREIETRRQLRAAADSRAGADIQLRLEAERRSAAEKAAIAHDHRTMVNVRRLVYALGVMALSLMGAAAIGWFAYRQLLLARSNELAAQAEHMSSIDKPGALDLAIRAWRESKTPAANIAIAHAFPQSLLTINGYSAAFSPSGDRLVTVDGKQGRVWNAYTGQEMAKLEGHSNSIQSALFAQDGQRIVTASWDGTARVWNASSGEVLAVVTVDPSVAHYLVDFATFSPDGTLILTVGMDTLRAEGSVRVWSAAVGQLVAELPGHRLHNGLSAEFSPVGDRILTTDGEQVRVWSTAGRLLTVIQPPDAVWQATFSPNGQSILTAGGDTIARTWNTNTGRLLVAFEGDANQVLYAQFSADGSRVITASADRTARVWNAVTGEALAKLYGSDESIKRAAFSPNGEFVLTFSGSNQLPARNEVRIWSTTGGQLLAAIPTETQATGAFSPDGHRIVVVDGNRTAVWGTTSARAVARLNPMTGGLSESWFSQNNQVVVTVGGDATVWNVATGQIVTARDDRHGNHVAISPDGQSVMTMDDDARVWNISNGQTRVVFTGHTGQIWRGSFSHDGHRVVTASSDRTARVWSAETGQELAKLQGHGAEVVDAQFSGDDKEIITASFDRTARIWDSRTGAARATLRGHSAAVMEASFSPSDQIVLTADNDGSVRVWKAATGEGLAIIPGDGGNVHAEFSTKGDRIVTADGTRARIWSPSGQLLATLTRGSETMSYATFSPDGERVVTVGQEARVWSGLNGEPLAWLGGQVPIIGHAAFSTDGQRIVTSGGSGIARLYSLATLSDIRDLIKP